MIRTLTPKRLASLLAAATAVTFGSASASIVIFEDDFTDGTNPGYVGPDNQTSVAVVGNVGMVGNALQLTTTGNNREAFRSFTPSVTLTNVGDFIELRADYRTPVVVDDRDALTAFFTGPDGDNGMRFNDAAGNSDGVYFTDSDSNAGRFDTIDSGTDLSTLVLRITKTSETEVGLTSSFDGTVSDNSNVQVIGTGIAAGLTFDGIALGWASGQQGILFFDNVSVITNVPEPASLSLVAAGLALMVGRRRAG